MAKKFNDLRVKMSKESQERTHVQAQLLEMTIREVAIDAVLNFSPDSSAEER